MSEPKVTVQDAINALVGAGRYLEWPNLDPSRALEMVQPYAEFEEFVDLRPGHLPRVRSLVCAVMGDCYRALGKAETAADWYVRARAYCATAGSDPFFAPFFASMVIDNKLAGHYLTAQECLRAHRAAWKAQPFQTRLYWHIVSLWWIRPYQWRMFLRESRLPRKLEALIRETTQQS